MPRKPRIAKLVDSIEDTLLVPDDNSYAVSHVMSRTVTQAGKAHFGADWRLVKKGPKSNEHYCEWNVAVVDKYGRHKLMLDEHIQLLDLVLWFDGVMMGLRLKAHK